jgi:tetrahydromethanopterin S-methyltransferase subunit A
MPQANTSTIFLHDSDVRASYQRNKHVGEAGAVMYLTELTSVMVNFFTQDVDILPLLSDETKADIVMLITRKEPEILDALENIA